MINDDKPLLRIEEDRVTVCGSPWRGKHRLGSNGHHIMPKRSSTLFSAGNTRSGGAPGQQWAAPPQRVFCVR